MSRRLLNVSLIIMLFILLALAYSLVVPIFNAPDEPFHFEYIRFLAMQKKLPNQTVKDLSITTEGFNPPLYYLIGAGALGLLSGNRASDIGIHNEQDLAQFYYYPEAGFSERIYPPLNPGYIKWGKGGRERNMFLTTSQDRFPFSGSIRVIHLLRLISVLIGALTVLFILKTAEILFPDHKSIALLSACLCAFNPQFTFLSGALNNDNLVTMFSAISLYLLTGLVLSERDNPRRLTALGAAIGLGLISKVNISFLVVISIIGVIYQTIASDPSRKLVRVIRNLALLLIPMAIISGWYFVRGVSLFGVDDPLGWKLQAIQNPDLVMPARIRTQFLTRAFAPMLFTSFWGQFDWLTIKLPLWIYGIYGLISLAGLAGVAFFLASGIRRKLWREREIRVTVCLELFLAAILLAVTNLVILNWNFIAAQGRLIFPVMAPLCIFMAMGVSSGLNSISRLLRVRQELVTYAFLVLLIGLNLYSLIGIIYPVYR
ncbi:MAG: glycosyltransferase family 39 protein [bacterium]